MYGRDLISFYQVDVLRKEIAMKTGLTPPTIRKILRDRKNNKKLDSKETLQISREKRTRDYKRKMDTIKM